MLDMIQITDMLRILLVSTGVEVQNLVEKAIIHDSFFCESGSMIDVHGAVQYD